MRLPVTYIKTLAICLVLVLIFSFIGNDPKKFVYEDNSVKCVYTFANGMFNGKYISYYKNGIKKAEGNFKWNNRDGEWIVWDSSANIKCKRTYTTSLAFKQTFPNNCDVTLPQKTEGFYIYNILKEADVLWEKRVWRNITAVNNPLLFKISFSDSLVKRITTGNILLYNEDFFDPLPSETVNQKIISGSRIIAFKIKEDVFIDASRQLIETRIIGVCPVIKNNKDTIEPGWMYFPRMRPFLSSSPLVIKQKPLIKNSDDLFYFRYFNSEIKKECNRFDRDLKNYCKTKAELQKEGERIEIQIIEADHDHWISFCKK